MHFKCIRIMTYYARVFNFLKSYVIESLQWDHSMKIIMMSCVCDRDKLLGSIRNYFLAKDTTASHFGGASNFYFLNSVIFLHYFKNIDSEPSVKFIGNLLLCPNNCIWIELKTVHSKNRVKHSFE